MMAESDLSRAHAALYSFRAWRRRAQAIAFPLACAALAAAMPGAAAAQGGGMSPPNDLSSAKFFIRMNRG